MSLTDDTPTWREALGFFLGEYLSKHRGFSGDTQEAYATALRLLLDQVGKGCDHPHELRVEDVLGFLESLERERGNKAQSRNLRLAALKCFWKAMLLRDPGNRERYEQLLQVPFKRCSKRSPDYLERDELGRLFAAVNPTTRLGFRDLALLRYAYNTGSRISELVNVRVSWLNFEVQPPEVTIRGKRDKVRTCPLWRTTAEMLRVYLCQERFKPRKGFEDFLFLSRRGSAFKRIGMYALICKYLDATVASTPSLRFKLLTPHSLRHTCAVHLLQAGVELNVIKAWLGHADVETTAGYLDLDLDKKREALERFLKLDVERLSWDSQSRSWALPPDVVSWLERL